VTRLADGAQCVVDAAGCSGDLALAPEQAAEAAACWFRRPQRRAGRRAGLFARAYVPAPRLLIVGAVHIAQALAPMAARPASRSSSSIRAAPSPRPSASPACSSATSGPTRRWRASGSTPRRRWWRSRTIPSSTIRRWNWPAQRAVLHRRAGQPAHPRKAPGAPARGRAGRTDRAASIRRSGSTSAAARRPKSPCPSWPK
jgi:hypothetical protein